MLQQQNFDREQSDVLLQLPLPDEARQVVLSALAQGDEDLEQDYHKALLQQRQDPQAEAYSPKALAKVIHMLEDLQHEFSEKRSNLQRDETQNIQNFKMFSAEQTQVRKNELTNLQTSKVRLGKKQATKGEETARLEKARETKAENIQLHDDTDVELHHATKAHEKFLEEEHDEISAIESAKAKLSEATGQFFFLQIEQSRNDDHVAAAARFLEGRADTSNSPALSALAVQVAAGGPFDKIKKMIENMITKLTEQAAAESEQKAWCDEQLATTQQSIELTQSALDEKSALNEKSDARAHRLSNEIKAAQKKKNQNMRRQEQLVEIFEKYSEENQQAMLDATNVTATVTAARNILEKVFENDSDNTFETIDNFLQMMVDDAQALHDDVKAQQKKMEADHEETLFQMKKERKMLDSDIEYKMAERDTASNTAMSAADDKLANSRKLNKLNAYFEKLQPPCVKPNVSHEDRMKARAAEIESLQEAVSILSGEEVTQ